MRPSNDPVTAKQVEELRERFELWRRDHPGRRPLPQELWSAAANLARHHGLSRTANALRLSYYSLKHRMPAKPVGGRKGRKTPPAASFIELLPSLPLSSATMPECSVELENARGAKIKIQLKGAAMSELSTLTRLFWSEL